MPQPRRELTFWWWGEDEAPGLAAWIGRVCSRFEQRHPGVRVRTRLLRHDEVLPGFPAAAAAGEAPDLHFFWNGIYLVENVWREYLLPLDELIDPDELAHLGGGPQSVVGGKTYRAGWYVIPVVWIANSAVLAGAGVPRLPTSWEEFEDACARVKRAGCFALTVGDGEADFSVWWLTHLLTQEFDTAAEACKLVLGELDWREPRYHAHWTRLADVRETGFLDLDAIRLTLWDGLSRFNEGRSAFTLGSGPMFAGCRRALGSAATLFVAPRTGDRDLAGLPIVDMQGLGISAGSRQPELAADFIRFLHEPAQRDSLWEEVRLFPADRRWGGGESIEDPDYRRMWRWFAEGPSAPYIPNLMPLDLHYSVGAAIGQAVLARELDGAQAGQLAWTRSRDWTGADPERLRRYRDWALDVARAHA